MSSKKSNKFAKSSNQHHHYKIQNKNQQQHNAQSNSSHKKQTNHENSPQQRQPKNSSSGLVVSIHKAWPDLQLNQSRLFFECTLFLYSVLALFLQYLNLYKTLWWMRHSFWPYSLKYHLINPYLLSCIGLLLGVRVTKCFWNTFSEKVDYFCKGEDGWKLTFWKIFEYALVKTPLTTIVCTSFLFSFTRIYLEFRVKALTYFFTPLLLNIIFFHTAFVNEFISTITYFLSSVVFLFRTKHVEQQEASLYSHLMKLKASIFVGPKQLLDLSSVVHLCSDTSEHTREEAMILLADFELRCRYCIYTALLTAYFAILMPRALIPMKTIIGKEQYMLIDDIWVAQLFAIVTLTAFSLYITYLFPINYFDLLYRCAVHLGYWEQIQPVQPLNQPQHPTTPNVTNAHHRRGKNAPNFSFTDRNEVYENYSSTTSIPYKDGTKIVYNENFYIARSHPHLNTVAACPGNKEHERFYRIAKDPIKSVTYLCIFQGALVAFEFWLLLLTSDWQQIVTLVLLLFSNYLLLGKMFKDRIVIGRIYKPSSEDLQLIKQLQHEMEMKRAQQEQQQQVPHRH